jgi:hypothetical protein
MHARKGRVERLEGRGVHRAVADRAGREEGDVRQSADLPDQRAEAVAEAEHVQHGISHIAEHRRNGQLAPDEEVPAPHMQEAKAESRKGEILGSHGVSP